ncbi:MAG: ferredoxin [Thermomicrobiales bacterium]|nr:ferredoxin [Thermomicrobiales bacterium]
MSEPTSRRGIEVTIDPHRCIGIGKCAAAAPGIYTLDEETGKAVLENGEEATVEQLFAGARACPTQAIIIEQFGRRVFPRLLVPMFGDKPGENGVNAGDSGESAS